MTTTDPLARIIAQVDDRMSSDNPEPRLPESLAETTSALALLDIAASLRRTESPTELALVDIAASLRTIAAALTSLDANGIDAYSPRPSRPSRPARPHVL